MLFSYEDLYIAIVDGSEGSCQVVEALSIKCFVFDY